jgi:RsiW-degrading membrane proteinase PrsW (M82 family)
MSQLVGFYLSVVAAIAPTIVFVLFIYWADRYEREPWWLVSVAFLWGALPAVVASIIGELILGIPLSGVGPSLGTEVVESALFAPVVEELTKGVALLGIFLWARYEFDGVLDGLVYGALVGFGFAMTENLFYFIGAFGEGGLGGLTVVFGLRVLLFGLNHAFYTGLIGIGFGMARHAKSRAARWFWPLAGLAAGIFTHALHNFGASVADVNAAGLGLSLLVALGGLLTIWMTILLAWQRERSVIRRELADEVGVLMSEAEYQLLVGRWRVPLRKRRSERSRIDRLQQLVELAQRKHHRRLAQNPEARLLAEIDQLSAELAASRNSML